MEPQSGGGDVAPAPSAVLATPPPSAALATPSAVLAPPPQASSAVLAPPLNPQLNVASADIPREVRLLLMFIINFIIINNIFLQ